MDIKEIIACTAHRPWDMPSGSWKFYQEWNHALFMHWQVSPDALEPFVPKALEIDLFEGKPWVSVVVFKMEKIRPRYFPAFTPISNFDEINIRTYVTFKEKSGVYFLSIEGGTNLSCKIAKGLSELPYRYSKIKRSKDKITSYNAEHNDSLAVEFRIGKAQHVLSKQDKWLTERYTLFQDTAKAINAFEIHHLEWPIHDAVLRNVSLNYPRFVSLLRNSPDKVHYSKGVKVIAWGKQSTQKNLLI